MGNLKDPTFYACVCSSYFFSPVPSQVNVVGDNLGEHGRLPVRAGGARGQAGGSAVASRASFCALSCRGAHDDGVCRRRWRPGGRRSTQGQGCTVNQIPSGPLRFCIITAESPTHRSAAPQRSEHAAAISVGSS